MSNASLKEQLQAVATQLTNKVTQENELSHPSRSSQAILPKPKQSDSNQKTKRPKPKWLDYVQYGVELLKVYFPGGFKIPSEVKPLKKGIKQDLIKELSTMEKIVTEDKACMVKSLTYYVNTVAYHKSVIEGVERIDLNGHPSGTVSAEEAKYSIERYQAKLAKQKSATQSPSLEKDMIN